jgi:hypothetical protein
MTVISLSSRITLITDLTAYQGRKWITSLYSVFKNFDQDKKITFKG